MIQVTLYEKHSKTAPKIQNNLLSFIGQSIKQTLRVSKKKLYLSLESAKANISNIETFIVPKLWIKIWDTRYVIQVTLYEKYSKTAPKNRYISDSAHKTNRNELSLCRTKGKVLSEKFENRATTIYSSMEI